MAVLHNVLGHEFQDLQLFAKILKIHEIAWFGAANAPQNFSRARAGGRPASWSAELFVKSEEGGASVAEGGWGMGSTFPQRDGGCPPRGVDNHPLAKVKVKVKIDIKVKVKVQGGQ